MKIFNSQTAKSAMLISCLALLQPASALAAEDAVTTTSPTFGFSVERELPPLEVRQQNQQRVVENMMKNADRQMEERQARQELERQETLLYIALQKLHGKTPLYGQEKADLEKIVADSRAKIKKLQAKYDLIVDKQTKEKIAEAEQTMGQQAKLYARRAAADTADASSKDSAVSGREQGFFSYGGEDENKQSTSRGLNGANGALGNSRDNPSLRAVDSVLQEMSRRGEITLEEEEEEQVTPLSSAADLLSPDDLLNSKDGILIPNQPLQMAPEMREKVRSFVQEALAQKNMHLKSYERDMLNAMLFNYGVQVLDDGRVITLEVYLPENYDTGRAMLAPGVPMPEGARQIVRAPINPDSTVKLIPESEFNPELRNSQSIK